MMQSWQCVYCWLVFFLHDFKFVFLMYDFHYVINNYEK